MLERFSFVAALPPLTLFWRTFLLIIAFLAIALLAWWQSIRVLELEPRAQAVARHIVSVVNLTRNALLYSDVQLRQQLLADLAANDGIRVALKESHDQVEALPARPFVERVSALVTAELGPATQLAAQVNELPGLWVSFAIADDAYWAVIQRDLLVRDLGSKWLAWTVVALLLSVLAAITIARALNRPLAQLIASAQAIGAGRTPTHLPDAGPAEIRTVNQSFNHMVSNLAQMEQDRAVLLAGISHDLRTPLTRLRLELEMSALAPETQQAMVGDIEQMDAIVRQFLDYARTAAQSAPQSASEPLDLSELIHAAVQRCRLETLPDVSLQLQIEPGVRIQGHATELARIVDNLLTNALRYGRDAQGQLTLAVHCQRQDGAALLSIADRGGGIAAEAMARVLRPFERGDSARSNTAGAGLGLAIVERIARLHGARFELSANTPQGLCAKLWFPLLELT